MRHLALAMAVALLPELAGGQTLRSVVVPADVGIAIPPRGQPLPETAPIRRELPGPRAGPPPTAAVAPAPAPPVAAAPLAAGPLAIAPALILPLVAGALLGGALPGSGGSGGTGAPATTR